MFDVIFLDGDGIPNFLDDDDIRKEHSRTSSKRINNKKGKRDSDGDGIPDHLDDDDDNDGLEDESDHDIDGDGRVDDRGSQL